MNEIFITRLYKKKEAELRAKPRKSNDQRDRGRQAKKERGQIKVKKEKINIFLIMLIFFTKETSSEKMDQNQKEKKEHQGARKKNRKGGREITWWVITKELKVGEQIQC